MEEKVNTGKLTLYAQLLLGMAIFGSGTPVSKMVTDGLPPFLASGLRMMLAAVVLLPFVWSRLDTLRGLRRRDYIALAGIVVIGMVGFSLFMFFGMRQVSGVLGSVIMSTTPVVTALGAWLFLDNQLGWRKIVAVLLAFCGVLILQLGDNSQQGNAVIFGSLLVFAAVCSEAAFTLLGRVVPDDLDPLTIAAVTSAGAFVIFIPLMLYDVATFDFSQTSLTSWLALFWWGAGTLALGTSLWYSGVQKVEGSIAAGFMGIMPVSALILSYVLLDEPFQWIHLLGFGVVFAGVLLIISVHRKSASDDVSVESANREASTDTRLHSTG